LMTFMERPAMSQVTSAIPSASTSILKFAIADSCSPAHDHCETGPTFRCSCLKRFAIFPRVTCAFFVTHHHHIDLGIMRALGRGTRTDFDKDRITIRTIDQTVSVGHARLPGGRIPRLEHDVASILPQHHLSLEHVDKFVLALMPVALRGRSARLERSSRSCQWRCEDAAPGLSVQTLTPNCVRPAARASRLRLRPSTALSKGGGYPVEVLIGILSMSIFGMLDAFDNRGRPHADADAQCYERGFLVAPLQFIENGAEDHRTGGAKWVAHGNGATIHVDFLVRNVERLHVAQHHRGK